MHQVHTQHLSSLQGEQELFVVPSKGVTWCTDRRPYLWQRGLLPGSEPSPKRPFWRTQIPACLFAEWKPLSHSQAETHAKPPTEMRCKASYSSTSHFQWQPSNFKSQALPTCPQRHSMLLSFLTGLKQSREKSWIKAITGLRLQGNQIPRARDKLRTHRKEGSPTGWLLGP